MFIGRKTLGARQEPTTNSTLTWHQDGIEPGGRRALSPLRLPCSPKEVYDGKMTRTILTKDFFNLGFDDLATAMWSNSFILIPRYSPTDFFELELRRHCDNYS